MGLIKSNGTILDIGANIGVMSAHLCRKFPNSEIFSFEPIPANIKAFKRVTKHYNLVNVKLFETAIGNVNGSIEMVMPVVKSVRFQGLSHVVQSDNSCSGEGDKYITPLTTIDNFFINRENALPVTAIKIDVENYEFYVLDGAKETISKYRPVIYCELWENQNRADCFKFMSTLNYSIMVLDKDKLIIFDPEIHKTQNFFFIPNN